jgi:hypothetical protein
MHGHYCGFVFYFTETVQVMNITCSEEWNASNGTGKGNCLGSTKNESH